MKVKIEHSSYKGRPLILFRADGEEDKSCFKFGQTKALKLLLAMKQHGVDEVVNQLCEMAGADPDNSGLKGMSQAAKLLESL